MSGHSKWHNIQVKKGKADKTKSSHFTKAARAITVAARAGGSDQATNFALRLAIEKAKEVNMPKDNIERAVKRGTPSSDGAGGLPLEEAVYEGFGPGGVAFMVEAITDNKVRTVSDLKNVFTKHGGSLGSPGSVQWQFQRCGVVRLGENQKSKVKNLKSDFELTLIDAGADDIIDSEYGIEIRCAVEKFQNVLEAVKTFLASAGLPAEALAEAGLEWVAKEPMTFDDAAQKKVQALYDIVEEMDDVKAVYTNEV